MLRAVTRFLPRFAVRRELVEVPTQRTLCHKPEAFESDQPWAKPPPRRVPWGGIAAAVTGGTLATVATQHYLKQYRDAAYPTRVTLFHGLTLPQARERSHLFVGLLAKFDTVSLRWVTPTVGHIEGTFIDGTLTLQDDSVILDARVLGPLKLRSREVHSLLVKALQQAMTKDTSGPLKV